MRARAERRIRHRHLEGAEQVVAVTAEHLVVPHVDLEVERAGGAAALADLALAGHLDAQARVDARGDVDRDRALGAHPAVTGARVAGLRDDGAVPLADRAGLARDDVAEQRAHLPLHMAGAAALHAPLGAGAGLGGRTVAGLAEHGRLHPQLAVHAEDDVGEVEVDAQQAVLARLPARARTAASARRRRRTARRCRRTRTPRRRLPARGRTPARDCGSPSTS